jgi:tetratricopeptide (TPR) repeat protein
MNAWRRALVISVLGAALGAPAAGAGADARGELAYNAGMRAIQQQDWSGAINRLESAIVFDPGNADAFERLGFAYFQLGKWDKALKYLRIALEIEPNHAAALSRHGLASLSAGQVDAAKSDLQRLSRKCGAGCAAHDELQRAIDSHRARAARD